MKVIVLNCYSRNALAIINNLDPAYEIIGGALKKHKKLNNDKIFKSKRLSAIFRYANPLKNPEEFKEDIIQACKFYKPHAVIPTGTLTTNYLSLYKQDIQKHTDTKLLVENYEVLSQLTDKWNTYNLCLNIDIPVPKTILLNSEQDITSLNFPVILKPRMSYASKGVQFFQHESQIKNFLYNIDVTEIKSRFIIQELIDGELHDVTICSKDGNVFSILSQKRLVTLYDFGGGGIINKTTFEPTIMEYAEKIVKHVKWNGAIEFDFIKDSRGNYFLLECNPKIWGTTQLTIEAGNNVAQQLIDLFVLNKDIKRNITYEVGLVYKWLFPECMFSWFQKPRNIKTILRRIFKSFKGYNGKRTIYNLNVKDIPHLIGIVLDNYSSENN